MAVGLYKLEEWLRTHGVRCRALVSSPNIRPGEQDPWKPSLPWGRSRGDTDMELDGARDRAMAGRALARALLGGVGPLLGRMTPPATRPPDMSRC